MSHWFLFLMCHNLLFSRYADVGTGTEVNVLLLYKNFKTSSKGTRLICTVLSRCISIEMYFEQMLLPCLTISDSFIRLQKQT